MTAGGLGSFVGNPCDLALVRMQADTTLPEAERRNYKKPAFIRCELNFLILISDFNLSRHILRAPENEKKRD